jgi:hypothetical protein
MERQIEITTKMRIRQSQSDAIKRRSSLNLFDNRLMQSIDTVQAPEAASYAERERARESAFIVGLLKRKLQISSKSNSFMPESA